MIFSRVDGKRFKYLYKYLYIITMYDYIYILYSCKKNLDKTNKIYNKIYDKIINAKVYIIYGDESNSERFCL